MKHSLYPSLSAFAFLLGTLALVGCGGAVSFSNPKSTDTPAPPAPQLVAGPGVKGYSYGGHAPIEAQHVYLLQPGTSGYGSAATSLLGNNGVTVDGNGNAMTKDVDDPNGPVAGDYYVTTDANGAFNLTGAYKCTSGEPVYIYAWGGKIAATALNNDNIVQLATLGNCPSSGNFSTQGNGAISYIYMNEVSTVAAAYTFQPYTLVGNNSAWDIGSTDTTQGLLGIANAANTAAQLYNIEGGTQLSTGPSDGEGHIANYQTLLNGVPNDGNGVVPQATIDTLANIVSDCVDSTVATVGTETSQCSSLFADARDNGETTGTEPTDTATAMINIARFPAGNNSATTAAEDALGIFALQSGTEPYVPDLTAAPNDWTIAINYPGPNNGVAGSSSGGKVTNNYLNSAESIAIDSSGQVWITSQGDPATAPATGYNYNPAILRFSNLGAQNAFSTYSYIPGYVSIDGSGDAWTGNANDSPGGGGSGTGTGIFLFNSNGVQTNTYGSGYYNAYVVIANQSGDAFFFASNSTLTPDYDMWEYQPGGSLTSNSPINISGTTTTTTTPGTGTLTITKAAENTTCTGLLCGIGVGTYTYNYTFTATNPGTPTGAAALAAGQTVKLMIADHNGGNNWTKLNGNQTVATANGTTFTVTGTANENISGDATGTGTYATTITGTTTTPGAIPAGQNVAHGAIDHDGDLWITTEADPSGGTGCNNGCEIARITPAGTPLFTSIVTAEQPEFPAIDASNNAWIAIQETDSQVDVVSPTGGTTILTPKGTPAGTTATGALMTSTFGTAVDGNGNVWFANRAGNYGVINGTSGEPATVAGENTIFVLNGGVGTLGTTYKAISPATNYVPETEYAGATTFTKMLDGPLNIAIDPSGDVWITNYTGGGVVELVGAAAPVVTPLSVAAGDGKLGQTP